MLGLEIAARAASKPAPDLFPPGSTLQKLATRPAAQESGVGDGLLFSPDETHPRGYPARRPPAMPVDSVAALPRYTVKRGKDSWMD